MGEFSRPLQRGLATVFIASVGATGCAEMPSSGPNSHLSTSGASSSASPNAPSAINVRALEAESERMPRLVASNMDATVRTFGYQCSGYTDGICDASTDPLGSGFEVEIGNKKYTITAGHVEDPLGDSLTCRQQSLVGRIGNLVFRDSITNRGGSFRPNGSGGADYSVPDIGIFQAAGNKNIDRLPTIPLDTTPPPTGTVVYGFGFAPTDSELQIYQNGPNQPLPLHLPSTIPGIVLGQYAPNVTAILETGTPSTEGDSGGPLVVGSGTNEGKAFGLISSVSAPTQISSIEAMTSTNITNTGDSRAYSILFAQDINPATAEGLADTLRLHNGC